MHVRKKLYLWLLLLILLGTSLLSGLWRMGGGILPRCWLHAIPGFRGQRHIFVTVRLRASRFFRVEGSVRTCWSRSLCVVTSSRGWLEFRVPACQRVIVLLRLVIRLKCVVWVVLKLAVLRGGGVLEAQTTTQRSFLHIVSQQLLTLTTDLPAGGVRLAR